MSDSQFHIENHILELTWNAVLKVWWAFFWRLLLFGNIILLLFAGLLTAGGAVSPLSLPCPDCVDGTLSFNDYLVFYISLFIAFTFLSVTVIFPIGLFVMKRFFGKIFGAILPALLKQEKVIHAI